MSALSRENCQLATFENLICLIWR